MMSHPVRPRLAIMLGGSLAVVAIVVTLLLTGAPSAPAASAPAPVSASELALRNGMRKLWEDHVTWTRVVIISVAAGLPDGDAAVNRLLRNQDDIGDAIKPYYGDAAGEQLSGLLRDHIVGAAKVLGALKSGDTAALNAALDAWYANGRDIAAFLSAANPSNWPLDEMEAMLKDHLDATAAEAVARFQGRWDDDVKAYDAAHEQMLEMADMLSKGIVAQFPRRFRP
jgi:hypothetical protein